MGETQFVQKTCCPICQSSKRTKLGLRGDRPINELPKTKSLSLDAVTVTVWDCKECRHIWVDPCPSEEMLFQLYEAQSEIYFEHLHSANLNSFLELLNKNSKVKGRLLDIGCGNGRILQAAVGWDSVGVEPVASFATNASQYGKVVSSLNRVTGSFEAISIMAVLEHVLDPFMILKQAFTLAAPGALLIVEVPNGHRPDASVLDLALRISGRPWTVRTAPLQTPFHLAEFSKSSLTLAAQNAGWKVEKVWTIRGTLKYPIPGPINHILNLIQRLGSPFGWGLNLTMIARKSIDSRISKN